MPVSLSPSPLATTTLFSMSMTISVLLCFFVFSLDSTYIWNHMVFVFIWHVSLKITASRCKWPDFTLFHDWVVLHWLICQSSLSIHLSMDSYVFFIIWLLEKTMLQWTSGCIHIFELVFSFSFRQTQKWICWIEWWCYLLNFLKNLETVFHISCIRSHSH